LLYPKKISSRKRKQRSLPWWSVRKEKVKILQKTSKAVQVRDKEDRILWIPEGWILDIRELRAENWEIKISRAHWAGIKPITDR